MSAGMSWYIRDIHHQTIPFIIIVIFPNAPYDDFLPA